MHPFPVDASSAPRAAEAQGSPRPGQVIDFLGRPDEPQAGDGDGGDGTEIVIRIVVDCRQWIKEIAAFGVDAVACFAGRDRWQAKLAEG